MGALGLYVSERISRFCASVRWREQRWGRERGRPSGVAWQAVDTLTNDSASMLYAHYVYVTGLLGDDETIIYFRLL